MREDLNESIAMEIAKLNMRGKDKRPMKHTRKRFQDARISEADINLAVRRANIQGDELPAETYPSYHLPIKTRNKIRVSRISDDDFIIMKEYAKYQPRGRRQLLRLDMPELRKLLLGNILKLDPQSNDSGLRQGGQVANLLLEDKTKAEVLHKLMTQTEQHLIYNGDAVQSGYNYNKSFALNNQNPNPTGFKNHFRLVSKTSYNDFRNHF